MSICVFCSETIEPPLSLGFIFSFQPLQESVTCATCFKKFKRIEAKQACPGCFRKQREQKMCRDCLKWKEKLSQFPLSHTALYTYNEMAREYMNQFKFQGDLLLAEVFSDVLRTYLKPWQKTHTIVPIPLSEISQKDRGFNQVEQLLTKAGISYQLLLEHRGTEAKQSSKSKAERMQTEQPFKLKDSERLRFEKPILIVDDVYTTGRTILHAREIFAGQIETASFSLFR
jgi:competence protein ComFC